MLPIIFYNLVQHLVAGAVDLALRRTQEKRKEESDNMVSPPVAVECGQVPAA
jgi:hypothetical protein